MKSLLCKVLSAAALAMLVAAPLAAADTGIFQLGQTVSVGDVQLPAGTYVFRASDRGLVLVYDESRTKVLAAALTQRHALTLRELEMSGTLAYDAAVRTLSLGDWRYSFRPSENPAALAANPAVTTVVAVAR